jgi:tetratricopeptide (TPR) repeat protein
MKCWVNVCAFVAVILTFAALAKAQIIGGDPTAVIQGEVIGRDGNALPNVTVAIDRVDLVQHFETKSDRRGNYMHIGLPAGSYVLSVVSDGEVTKVDARLRPRAILNLDLDLRRFAPYDPAERNRVNKAALTIPRKARDEWKRAVDAKDDIEKAREHLEKALEIAPDYEEALNDRGTIYHRKKQYAHAAELFRRALKVNPDSLTARINLGASLLELNQYQRALDESLIVLKSRPDDSQAHAQAGLALFELRQYQSAIPHLEQANRSDPDSPLVPGYFLASAYDIMGNKPAAITEYESFLKTHPRRSRRN